MNYYEDCQKKARFRTYRKAIAERSRLLAKKLFVKRVGCKLVVYECPFCLYYHLGNDRELPPTN